MATLTALFLFEVRKPVTYRLSSGEVRPVSPETFFGQFEGLKEGVGFSDNTTEINVYSDYVLENGCHQYSLHPADPGSLQRTVYVRIKKKKKGNVTGVRFWDG